MALDIGFIGKEGQHVCRMQFDDDGYYWFLHPWFARVHATTGRYLDLYGDAEIHSGNGLVVLQAAMAEALAVAKGQPVRWSVQTGTQLKPVHKKLYATVERSRLVQTITVFQRLLEEARESGSTLVCLGD